MKATLKYDLKEPDEWMSHFRAVKSLDMALAISDLSEYLRRVDKYDTGEDIEAIRATFYKILEDRGLDLEELIN